MLRYIIHSLERQDYLGNWCTTHIHFAVETTFAQERAEERLSSVNGLARDCCVQKFTLLERRADYPTKRLKGRYLALIAYALLCSSAGWLIVGLLDRMVLIRGCVALAQGLRVEDWLGAD